MIRKKYDVTY